MVKINKDDKIIFCLKESKNGELLQAADPLYFHKVPYFQRMKLLHNFNVLARWFKYHLSYADRPAKPLFKKPIDKYYIDHE